jgi:hypothetical protein
MDDPKDYDALSGVVFLVGVYEGLVPIVAQLVFGDDAHLLLALPLRLSPPWVWIVSAAALVAAVVALAAIDNAKNHRFPEPGEPEDE